MHAESSWLSNPIWSRKTWQAQSPSSILVLHLGCCCYSEPLLFFLFGSDPFAVCLLRSVRWVATEQSLLEFLLNTKEARLMTPLLTNRGRLIFHQCFGFWAFRKIRQSPLCRRSCAGPFVARHCCRLMF
jgi:hypothetical protein